NSHELCDLSDSPKPVGIGDSKPLNHRLDCVAFNIAYWRIQFVARKGDPGPAAEQSHGAVKTYVAPVVSKLGLRLSVRSPRYGGQYGKNDDTCWISPLSGGQSPNGVNRRFDNLLRRTKNENTFRVLGGKLASAFGSAGLKQDRCPLRRGLAKLVGI